MFNSKKNLKKDLRNFMQHQNIFGQFLNIFNFTKKDRVAVYGWWILLNREEAHIFRLGYDSWKVSI